MVGCQKEAENSATPKPAGTATTAPTDAPAIPGAPPKEPTPAVVKLGNVDQKLKGDGFSYYGLGYEKPLTYSYVQDTGAKPTEGTQIVQISGTPESPVFHMIRGGSLADLGSEDLIIKADGVYAIGSKLGKFDPPTIALPNNLTVGKSWTNDQNIKKDSTAVHVLMDNKVSKAESVTTPAGTFDTFKVHSAGRMTTPSQNVPFSSDSWYAKEVGLVKFSLTTKGQDGKSVTATMILTKK